MTKQTIEMKTKTSCGSQCPVHGNLRVRGRSFEGSVIKKFPKRVTLVFGRTMYIRKYERYAKATTKLHARLPPCMEQDINIGDVIRVTECRPLSKIIHFVVVAKLKQNDARKKQMEDQ